MAKPERTYFVSIELPASLTADDIKAGWNILSKILPLLHKNESAMQGYMFCANRDGYPVNPGLAKGEQLEELCVRAFWWAFERIAKEAEQVKRLKRASKGGPNA